MQPIIKFQIKLYPISPYIQIRMILLVCGCYVVFVGPIAVINMTDAEGKQSGQIIVIYRIVL